MHNKAIQSLVLVCGVFLVTSAEVWAQPKGGPAPVVAAKVKQQVVAVGQTYVATVMPMKRSAVGSAVDGRVADFPVNHGDRVKKGQALAQLLTETIQASLDNASAELKLRESELLELKNGSRDEEKRMADAKMRRAKLSMEYTTSKHQRNEMLFQQRKSISEDEYEQSKAAAAESEQLYSDTVAFYEMTMTGPRPEKIAQAEARVAMQEALVKQFTDQLRKHTMISPFDGYVVAEHTEVGQWVSRGELVAEIVMLDEVEVQASVLESQIQYVKIGQEARVEVPALKNKIFVGQVSRIVPEADSRSRTFPVMVRLKNEIDDVTGPLLKSGMLARIVLPTGPEEQVTLVPKDSLVLGGPKTLVMVIDPDPQNPKQGTIRPVPVDLGIAAGNWVEVKGALEPGQTIVVQGNERVRPMQPVMIIKMVEEQTDVSANTSSVP